MSGLRTIVAVFIGFVVSSLLMMAIETVIGNFVYPELAQAVAKMEDREEIRRFMATAPTGAFIAILVAWATGAFFGGLVAALIGRRAKMRHAAILGMLLVLAGVASNMMLPPPIWFWFAGLISLFVFAMLGGQLAMLMTQRKSDTPATNVP